jgi:hypothetical protein
MDDNPYESPQAAAAMSERRNEVFWLMLRGFAALFCILLALAQGALALWTFSVLVYFSGQGELSGDHLLWLIEVVVVGAGSAVWFASALRWLTKRDGKALFFLLIGLLSIFPSLWLLR